MVLSKNISLKERSSKASAVNTSIQTARVYINPLQKEGETEANAPTEIYSSELKRRNPVGLLNLSY